MPDPVFAALCLLVAGLAMHAGAATGGATGAESRQPLFWTLVALVLVLLGVACLVHGSRFMGRVIHHLGGGARWRAYAHVLPWLAVAAALGLAPWTVRVALPATRSSGPLQGTILLSSFLVLLTIVPMASFSLRMALGRFLGPFVLQDLLQLGGLVGIALLALRTMRRRGSLRPMMLHTIRCLLVGAIVLFSVLEVRAARGRPNGASSAMAGDGLHDAIGGGFTTAGLWGEYFANSELAGPPAFARRDVRIDFDWGAVRAPGGSTSPGFAGVGHDHFSVRWTGRIIPRFDESYTFALSGHGVARLWRRETKGDRWTLLADTGTGAGRGAPVALTAGAPIEIKLEYRQTGGPAGVRLTWSSASTPLEIVEPISRSGINVTGAAGYLGNVLWADAMKGGRYQWTAPNSDRPVPLDEEGWPLQDADNITFEGAIQTRGRYRLSFEGQAEVSTDPRVSFEVAGSLFDGTLPKGSGYDPRTNTTHAVLRLEEDASLLMLRFRQTQRGARPGAGGVRAVQLMRPVSPGAEQSYPSGTLFAEGVKSFFGGFTTLRWILNFDHESRWSERNRPTRSKAMRDTEPPIWEHAVMLANETGRDLYLCTPINASDDYLLQLARLIRYGSDAQGVPYQADRRDPAHPGLNPNLKLYVERSNEVWNWSFSQSQENQRQAREAVAKHTVDGAIVNYDHLVGDGDGGSLWLRWHALQTKRISDVFRRVFGDAAMGSRVRMLYEYQYDDLQSTASEGLGFLDRYFNNGDGPHVTVPQPVAAYLWGAGAATYYGSGNPSGAQQKIVVPDGGFERAANTTPWKFQGGAGLYRMPEVADAVKLVAAGPAAAAPGVQLGLRFTVGSRPLWIYEMGRLAGPADKHPHVVRIVRADERSEVAGVTVEPKDPHPGRYTFVRLLHPVQLPAGGSFLLTSEEAPDGDVVYRTPESTSDPAFRADGGLLVKGGVPWELHDWKPDDRPLPEIGPGNFRFATVATPGVGFPPSPAEGHQAAYIRGPGEVAATVDFGRGGLFAMQLRIAGREDAVEPVDFYLDDQRTTSYGGGRDPRVNPEPFVGGRWSYDVRDLLPYSSVPVPASGLRHIRVVGRGKDPQAVFLDDVHIVSTDAIFDGGMPGRGEANGQSAVDDYAWQIARQARYAQAYGLRVVAYEGGWSVGGDFQPTTVQSAAKYEDPRAGVINERAIGFLDRSGYALNLWGTFDLWPTSFETPARASGYPLVQSVARANDRLLPEPTDGQRVPAQLLAAKATWAWPNADRPGQFEKAGDLVSFNVDVTKTDKFDLVVDSTGPGTLRVCVDGGHGICVSGSAGHALAARGVSLSWGLHAVTVQCTHGTALVRGLSIDSAAGRR